MFELQLHRHFDHFVDLDIFCTMGSVPWDLYIGNCTMGSDRMVRLSLRGTLRRQPYFQFAFGIVAERREPSGWYIEPDHRIACSIPL